MFSWLIDRIPFSIWLIAFGGTLVLCVRLFFRRDPKTYPMPESRMTERWMGIDLGVYAGINAIVYGFLNAKGSQNWEIQLVSYVATSLLYVHRFLRRGQPEEAKYPNLITPLIRKKSWQLAVLFTTLGSIGIYFAVATFEYIWDRFWRITLLVCFLLVLPNTIYISYFHPDENLHPEKW